MSQDIIHQQGRPGSKFNLETASRWMSPLPGGTANGGYMYERQKVLLSVYGHFISPLRYGQLRSHSREIDALYTKVSNSTCPMLPTFQETHTCSDASRGAKRNNVVHTCPWVIPFTFSIIGTSDT